MGLVMAESSLEGLSDSQNVSDIGSVVFKTRFSSCNGSTVSDTYLSESMKNHYINTFFIRRFNQHHSTKVDGYDEKPAGSNVCYVLNTHENQNVIT